MSKRLLKPEETPVHQGYLQKQAGTNILTGRSLQKRWCCLYRPFHLYYFEREDSTLTQGILDLREVISIELTQKKKKKETQFLINIHTAKKIHIWLAYSQADANKWLDELCNLLQVAKNGGNTLSPGSNNVRTTSESDMQFHRNISVSSLGSVNGRLNMSTQSTSNPSNNGTNYSSNLGFSMTGKSLGGGSSMSGPSDNWMIDPNELNFDEGKVLGKGSFGCVQLATWRGSSVAVKTLYGNVGASDDFVHELGMLCRLHHPNIVQLLGYCSSGSGPMAQQCLVTEYLPGGSLSQYLTDLKNSGQPLDFRLMLNIAMDTCKGMICLHAEKPPIIHRDLKTANILLASTSPSAPVNAKVADFGIATEHQQTSEHTRHQGTFIYMAPEVFSSDNYTVKVDIFSFGLILWEMLSLERPWKEHKFQFQIEEAIVKGARPVIPDFCPPVLRELICKCWSGPPDDRPDFIDILKKLKTLHAEQPPISEQGVTNSSLGTSISTNSPIILSNNTGPTYGEYAETIMANMFEGKEIVTWQEFCNECSRVLHARAADLVKIKSILSDDSGNVSKRSYTNFLKWFSPLNQEDDIYEESTKTVETGISISEIKALFNTQWFHGMIDANTTLNRLQNQPSGTYLIRFSGSEPGNYALSMNDNGKIRHWKIIVSKTSDRSFTINNKQFPSLQAIITQTNFDFLETKMGSAPMLKIPCPKEEK